MTQFTHSTMNTVNNRCLIIKINRNSEVNRRNKSIQASFSTWYTTTNISIYYHYWVIYSIFTALPVFECFVCWPDKNYFTETFRLVYPPPPQSEVGCDNSCDNSPLLQNILSKYTIKRRNEYRAKTRADTATLFKHWKHGVGDERASAGLRGAKETATFWRIDQLPSFLNVRNSSEMYWSNWKHPVKRRQPEDPPNIPRFFQESCGSFLPSQAFILLQTVWGRKHKEAEPVALCSDWLPRPDWCHLGLVKNKLKYETPSLV